MFLLTGLVGALLLGSVAVIGTAPVALDEDEFDDGPGTGPDPADAAADPFGLGAGGWEEADWGGPATPAPPEPSAPAMPDPGTDGPTPPMPEGSDTSSYRVSAQGGLVIAAGDGPDAYEGTDLTDQIAGGGGADTLDGGAGDDEVMGDGDGDVITGGAGNDTLHGGAGPDTVAGGAGNDLLFAYDGGDRLFGDAGDDVLNGGLGRDLLEGSAGADSLHGREGADTIRGGAGIDALFGGPGDDVLDGRGDAERDFLNGGPGDDLLWAGAGDVTTGSEGADAFCLDARAEAPARLTDFDPAEDRMVIFVDDDIPEAPDLSVAPGPEGSGLTRLLAGGVVVAELPEGSMPPIEEIALLPMSAAAALGS